MTAGSGLYARLDLPPGRTAVRTARSAARAVLSGWGLADLDWLDQAELVVTELVANAVQHVGGPLSFELSAHDGAVTVAVIDGSPVPPAPRRPDSDGGRGLLIVGSLAADWGSRDQEGGKIVWARLVTGQRLEERAEPIR